MTTRALTLRERALIERAHSQALYFIHRGLADRLKILAPDVPADLRSKVTGIAGTFLVEYVSDPLGAVVASLVRDDAAPPSDDRAPETTIDITQ